MVVRGGNITLGSAKENVIVMKMKMEIFVLEQCEFRAFVVLLINLSHWKFAAGISLAIFL